MGITEDTFSLSWKALFTSKVTGIVLKREFAREVQNQLIFGVNVKSLVS